MIKPTKGRDDNPSPTRAGQKRKAHSSILSAQRFDRSFSNERMTPRSGWKGSMACFDGDQVFVESSWNKAHFMEMKQNSGGKWPHIDDPQLGGIVSSKNEHSRTHRPVSHRGLIGLIRSSRWGCLEQS